MELPKPHDQIPNSAPDPEEVANIQHIPGAEAVQVEMNDVIALKSRVLYFVLHIIKIVLRTS